MTMVFNYIISEDVIAGKVDPDRLIQEIRLSAIAVALGGVGVKADALTVQFKADLSLADKTLLDGDTRDPCGGIIGNHSGEPLPDPRTSGGIPIMHLDSPVAEGDTPVVASNTWPISHSVVWCGEGDDVANGVVGDGADFRVEVTEVGDVSVESQFIHLVRLGGGHVYWKNCEYGDHASQLIYAPATPNIVSNPGSGAYGKLQVAAGVNMIVAPGTPGADGPDWDVDLTEKLNANVDFIRAVPIPASDGNGFFTYDPATDSLTYTPGEGTHNLFDAEIGLAKFIRKLWLVGDGCAPLTVYDNIPAVILPQWKSRVVVHRESATGSNRQLVWSMLVSRLKTV